MKKTESINLFVIYQLLEFIFDNNYTAFNAEIR